MCVNNLTSVLQSQNWFDWLKDQLIQEFDMKDFVKAKTIIGWEISQDISTKMLKIDQKVYIHDLLEFQKKNSCHRTVYPMKVDSSITLDQVRKYMQAIMISYQRLLEKLIYICCGTQLDISFVVGQLSYKNLDPQANHLQIAKKYYNTSKKQAL